MSPSPLSEIFELVKPSTGFTSGSIIRLGLKPVSNNIIAPIIYINRSKLCVVTVEWNKPLYIPNPEPMHVRINPHIARLPVRNIIIATREKENKLSRLKVTALIIINNILLLSSMNFFLSHDEG